MGARVLSLGVKWSGCEVGHSTPSIAKVKNEWSYMSSPPISLYGVDSDNFIFITLSFKH
jgi:hypothetical protein